MSENPDRHRVPAVSRRTLLGSGTLLVGGVVAACSGSEPGPVPPEGDISAPERTPLPPDELTDYQFLTVEEARTLEAVVARIIPGDDADPGALQAGVPTYIDTMLASFDDFAEPTYLAGPAAVAVDPGEPAPPGEDVAVAADQLYRYGFQSGNTPQDVYRLGLAALDRYAQTRFGALYAELSEARQDELLEVLEAEQSRGEDQHTGYEPLGGGGADDGPSDQELDRAVDVFGDISPGEFFGTVRSDTIAGMFADPSYGGNAGLAGWLLVGFPGSQRSYSPQEMLHGTTKQPQSMAGLTPMNPDRRGPHEREGLEQRHHHGPGG